MVVDTSRMDAIPKSASFGVPSSVSRMLAGFTSLWMIPARWLAPRASAMRATTEIASAACIGPRRFTCSSSEPPPRNSITTYGRPVVLV